MQSGCDGAIAAMATLFNPTTIGLLFLSIKAIFQLFVEVLLLPTTAVFFSSQNSKKLLSIYAVSRIYNIKISTA